MNVNDYEGFFNFSLLVGKEIENLRIKVSELTKKLEEKESK